MYSSIYFLSDFHLPVYQNDAGKQREKKIIRFLESIADSAKEIFLLGDIFDFWFEYQHVIPKGYTRLMGMFAKLSDAGVVIHYFTGNHDMWLRDYFEKELGFKVYFQAQEFVIDNKVFYIGHGDGLGPRQWKYKFLKRFVFQNHIVYPFFIRLFHPDWLMPLGNFWSVHSKKQTAWGDKKYLGDEKEFLVLFCKQYLQKKHVDYFIFGHRHLSLAIALNDTSIYFNTGDMIDINTYIVYDGHVPQIKFLL